MKIDGPDIQNEMGFAYVFPGKLRDPLKKSVLKCATNIRYGSFLDDFKSKIVQNDLIFSG